MHDFIMTEDCELWDIFCDGPFVPIKTSGEYTEGDKKALKKNARAKKILVYGLEPNEYDIISTCDTAKEIWETLKIAYDGTTQVKQDKSNSDDSSMMAVEGEETGYDSMLDLMGESDNDEDNGGEEVNFRDVQKNLKSYSTKKKLMCLADVLITAFCSLAEDRDSLFLELEKSEHTRKDLVAVITDQKNATETLRKEKSDLLAEAADQRKKIVEPLTKSKLENPERGKEIVSEEYVRLEEEVKALRCRMSTEIEKNELLQANLEKGTVKGSGQQWFMDSGCSKHMIGNTTNFLCLKDLQGGSVSFGNGKKGYILGVGKVGKSLTHSIENVYYVNGLIYKNIYVADFESLQSSDLSYLKAVDDDAELWHRRLDNASFSLLNKLIQKDLVHGLPLSQFKTQKVCDVCARGKYVKSSFKSKRDVSTSKPLELLDDYFVWTYEGAKQRRKEIHRDHG
ncbi:uncharacterized protein [Nicotiana sylvestris]|uniref:uncharacterized protein n=1 Tax=Nicotiana sylvestris TaxID=4096 RepID=UPI00388CD20B